MFDRKRFFDGVRARPFGGALARSQVEGLTLLLDAGLARGLALAPLAYVLATAFHETAATMRPIEEYGRGRGRDYGRPDPQTGKTYFGRGYVQLTWRRNYAAMSKIVGADLVAEPERALDPEIACRILFEGMTRGLFTGVGLDRHFSGGRADWRGARRIVNGTDRASLIAALARQFHDALLAATRATPEFPQQRSMSMKGYRTLAFNAAIALVGFAESVDWTEVLGSPRAGLAVAAISLANLALRAMTTGPVGPPPKPSA